MKKNENKTIETILEKIGISEAKDILAKDLLNVLQENSFGFTVDLALEQKKRGHFAKAMLIISEVNRDQILSIRKIQSIMDEYNDTPKTTIIFEKYRQFYPFQIGLRNGGYVLELLEIVNIECNYSLEKFMTELHENEKKLVTLQQELNFYEYRMKGQISENKIINLKNNIDDIEKSAIKIKIYLFDSICNVILREYSETTISTKISLIKNVYLILSSSIQTVDAELVKVE